MSAGQKVRHLLANSFEVSVLNQFLRTLKSTITTSFASRQLATSNEILVARTKFFVALATRKAQFQTLGKRYQPRPSAWLIALSEIVIIPDIIKASSNNCLVFCYLNHGLSKITLFALSFSF